MVAAWAWTKLSAVSSASGYRVRNSFAMVLNPAEDQVGRRGPLETIRILVVDGELLRGRGSEGLHAPECATANPLVRDFRKEPLHLIEPRRARRGEVDDVPRVPQQPLLHPRGLVRPVVVHDQVNGLPVDDRQGGVQVVKELHELVPPVPPVATLRAANRDVVPCRT